MFNFIADVEILLTLIH